LKRWGLAVALLASLGLNLGLVGAQLARRGFARGPEPGAPRGIDPGGRLAARLGLEGEARARFLEIQRELATTVHAERREMLRARAALRAELVGDAPDRERIDRLLAEVAARQRAVDTAFAENVLATRAVLDGRQLALYLRFVERFTPPRPGERLRDRLGLAPGRPGMRRAAPPPLEDVPPPRDDAPPPP
jgi:hypothetical protein